MKTMKAPLLTSDSAQYVRIRAIRRVPTPSLTFRTRLVSTLSHAYSCIHDPATLRQFSSAKGVLLSTLGYE